MSDAQRLDWLEREPSRLVCHQKVGGYKFQVVVERAPRGALMPRYSAEYDTLREAIDEGMKHVL